MAIDDATVRHVALLARLEVPEADVARYARELSAVLEYAEQLGRLGLERFDPLTEVNQRHPAARADTVGPGLARDEALAAAPATDGVYYLVPPVVEYPE